MSTVNQVEPILQEDKVHADDFVYDLPESVVTEFPAEPRDTSKLMVIDRKLHTRDHKIFQQITDYFEEGDVLVVNDTEVMPSRFHTRKEETGDQINVSLLRELSRDIWEVSVFPPRKVRIGNTLIFSENLQCDVIDNTVSSGRVVKFYEDGYEVPFLLQEIGMMPLPPYINREPEPRDRERYQTVFAKNQGAVAAPSAGLHFTEKLVEDLKKKGVTIVAVTLHTGMDFYEPITVSEVSKHNTQSEHYIIPEQSARTINEAHRRGNKVIAAGASTVRALESSQFEGENVVPRDDWTDLFIYPPFHFTMIDGIISNFHHPQSKTLIMQSAFYGVDQMMGIMQEAIEKEYRFGSFGDAMLLI